MRVNHAFAPCCQHPRFSICGFWLCLRCRACQQELALHHCHSLFQCLSSVFSRHHSESLREPQRSSSRKFKPAPLTWKDVTLNLGLFSRSRGLHVHVQFSQCVTTCQPAEATEQEFTLNSNLMCPFSLHMSQGIQTTQQLGSQDETNELQQNVLLTTTI